VYIQNNFTKFIQVTKIYSISGMLGGCGWVLRPLYTLVAVAGQLDS